MGRRYNADGTHRDVHRGGKFIRDGYTYPNGICQAFRFARANASRIRAMIVL